LEQQEEPWGRFFPTIKEKAPAGFGGASSMQGLKTRDCPAQALELAFPVACESLVVPTMANQKDKPIIEPTTKARAGVTGHNVRYVLLFGLVGVIIAFLIIGLYFYGVRF
jgi:hypothetical protein